VDHGNTQIRGGGKVDGVEADAVAAHHLELLARRHQGAGAQGLGPEENTRSFLGDLDHARLALLVGDDHARFALELLDAIGMDGPGQDDEGLHGSPLRG
jgi:hypothetical protein